VNDSIGILEVSGFTPAMVALDAMEKAADIHVVQAELNDFLGTVIKIGGSVDAVAAAMSAGTSAAARFGVTPVSTVIPNPEPSAMQVGILSRQERSPLLDQNVVLGQSDTPKPKSVATQARESAMAETPNFALGFIETQGFTAVFEAIDTACKAANVEVLAKEKLGGGYITIVIKGDVAAVNAAVEAGKSKVGSLGKLIAAHVIARPSGNVLALLPK
jgi:carbon dioxide concentrating mechanism protein CcmO